MDHSENNQFFTNQLFKLFANPSSISYTGLTVPEPAFYHTWEIGQNFAEY